MGEDTRRWTRGGLRVIASAGPLTAVQRFTATLRAAGGGDGGRRRRSGVPLF